MIDLFKFDTKTRNGTPVGYLSEREHHTCPIIGKYRRHTGEWEKCRWLAGGYFIDASLPHGLDLVIREENKQLSWTKEKRTEPGWYWYIDGIEDEPEVCEIYVNIKGGLMIIVPGYIDALPIDDVDGYWYGPIEKPEGPDVAT